MPSRLARAPRPSRITPLVLSSLLGLAACDSPYPIAASIQPAVPIVAGPHPAPGLDIHDREFGEGRNRLGVNLPPVYSWSNTPMYADLMRQARRFGTPETPWDEKALLGDDGWPVGNFGIMLTSSQGNLSANGGTYTVRFKGRAKIRVVASPAVLGPARYDPVTDITTHALDVPDRADQLVLSFTEVGQSIKDLRVIRPGYDAARPPLFTREFLDHIAPFQVVRLMDWLRTNNNPISRWSMRATDATMHYASEKGVPWEHAVELARVAGKDLWINIPGKADDDYVRNLARLLHEQLPATTRLYVEYSNEVWNSMFSQTRENLAAAVQEVETRPDSKLNHDGKNNPDIWKARRIAQRGKEISDIFREVFGAAAMMTRVRPVYAVQIVNTYATSIVLDYMAKVHGPPNRYFYALAGAPYFNLGPEQKKEGLNADAVLAAWSDNIDAMPRINRFEKNHALARWYQLPFLAYEGGADSFGPGSLEAKKAASLDPRLEPLCRHYLDSWHASGGGLFMWFMAGAGKWTTPYGTWELTTDLAITDTPKIRCLHGALAAGKPVPRGRNPVPGRIDALAYAGNETPFSEKSSHVVRYSSPGSSIDYLVLATAAGPYRLTLHADAKGNGNRIEVATAFGAPASVIDLPDTGYDKPADSAPVSIWLREGFNTIRLKTVAMGSGFHLRHLDIQPASAPGRAP